MRMPGMGRAKSIQIAIRLLRRSDDSDKGIQLRRQPCVRTDLQTVGRPLYHLVQIRIVKWEFRKLRGLLLSRSHEEIIGKMHLCKRHGLDRVIL